MNPLIYLTDWLKAGLLTLGVTLTGIFQPYDDFKREVYIVQQIPLEQKAAIFEIDILLNFVTSENIFLYEHPINLGDMCIWNGVHVAYRAIRYGQTKQPYDLILLKRFVKSLEALQTHPETGETILLRGRVPLAEYNGTHGGYRQVHQNDTMIWREDASGDSFVGHVYGLAMAYKYGDEEVKEYVGKLAIDLYRVLRANKYHLKNTDDTKTRFSGVGPAITSSPARVIGLLVLTKVIEIYNPDSEFAKDYYKLAIKRNQIHVAANSMVMGLWIKKYPNMNLVKMSIHALLEFEETKRYKKKYLKALRRGWRALDVDGDTYLTAILYKHYPKIIKEKHIKAALITLNEFSTNHKIAYGINLENDPHIYKVTWGKGSKKLKAIQPYPVWKQPAKDYYWQRDPHDLKDHGTCQVNCKSFSGLDFLMAFYVSKTYGLIK